MSHMKKFMVKVGLLAIVAWGGYNWVNQSPEHRDAVSAEVVSVIQTTEENANAAVEKTGEFKDRTTAAASNALGSLAINSRADALQDSAKPLRRSIRKSIRPVTGPIVKAANKADKKVSLVGIAFMLIASVMVAIMTASLLNESDYA